MAEPGFKITALQLSDVPFIAQISSDAFEHDRQTIMKGMGSEPFRMKEHALEDLPRTLQSPRCVMLKAVDNDTGETMGYINWVFNGFSPEEIPQVEGRVQPPPARPVPPPKAEEQPETEAEKARRDNPIQRLIALQDADIKAWMDGVMPGATRCLFVGGLQVAPKFQRRGVGSALLRFGTKFCDEHDTFAWVHSSESAFPAYAKAGFKVIRVQDCDLDEYAPGPPPNEGPDAKWGHYILRYMMYLPGMKA